MRAKITNILGPNYLYRLFISKSWPTRPPHIVKRLYSVPGTTERCLEVIAEWLAIRRRRKPSAFERLTTGLSLKHSKSRVWWGRGPVWQPGEKVMGE